MQKTPARPEMTTASLSTLLAHYNSQIDRYNATLTGRPSRTACRTTPMLRMSDECVASRPQCEVRSELVHRIRRQNRGLGRTIRHRALQLLEARIKGSDGMPMVDEDGRSVGLKYLEVLDILRSEFPEASTSVACLRWYIVHLKIDANDQGLPWPDLPQRRPRSIVNDHVASR